MFTALTERFFLPSINNSAHEAGFFFTNKGSMTRLFRPDRFRESGCSLPVEISRFLLSVEQIDSYDPMYLSSGLLTICLLLLSCLPSFRSLTRQMQTSQCSYLEQRGLL